MSNTRIELRFHANTDQEMSDALRMIADQIDQGDKVDQIVPKLRARPGLVGLVRLPAGEATFIAAA